MIIVSTYRCHNWYFEHSFAFIKVQLTPQYNRRSVRAFQCEKRSARIMLLHGHRVLHIRIRCIRFVSIECGYLLIHWRADWR